MTRFLIGRTTGTACVLLAMLSSVHAQEANPPAGGQSSPGPMTVERVREGWAIAPDFKVTRFDGGTHTLAGVYGGWVVDNTLMIGGAGYWLTDPNRTRKLSYGGVLIEWRERTSRALGFSVKGLLGAGSATASRAVTLIGFDRDFGIPPAPTVVRPATLAFRENFFVAEPEADLLVKIATHVRLHVGGGYRAVGGAEGLGSEISGATGSISLEIGPSSRP